jgi:hypothetical protein
MRSSNVAITSIRYELKFKPVLYNLKIIGLAARYAMLKQQVRYNSYSTLITPRMPSGALPGTQHRCSCQVRGFSWRRRSLGYSAFGILGRVRRLAGQTLQTEELDERHIRTRLSSHELGSCHSSSPSGQQGRYKAYHRKQYMLEKTLFSVS